MSNDYCDNNDCEPRVVVRCLPGPRGPRGPATGGPPVPGPQGPAGPAGDPFPAPIFAARAPSNAEGINGQVFWDTSTFRVYQKQGGVWALKGQVNVQIDTSGLVAPWVSNVAYDAGQLVRHNGRLFVATQPIQSTNAPTTGAGTADGWEELSATQVPAWLQGEQYILGALVYHDGEVWRAVANIADSQNEPGTSAEWERMQIQVVTTWRVADLTALDGLNDARRGDLAFLDNGEIYRAAVDDPVDRNEWDLIPMQVGGLTDVDLTGLAAGDVLSWDGADWVNAGDVIRDGQEPEIRTLTMLPGGNAANPVDVAAAIAAAPPTPHAMVLYEAPGGYVWAWDDTTPTNRLVMIAEPVERQIIPRTEVVDSGSTTAGVRESLADRFPSIATAIAVAQDGDTLLIYKGAQVAYTEPLIVDGIDLDVQAEECTIQTASQATMVVRNGAHVRAFGNISIERSVLDSSDDYAIEVQGPNSQLVGDIVELRGPIRTGAFGGTPGEYLSTRIDLRIRNFFSGFATAGTSPRGIEVATPSQVKVEITGEVASGKKQFAWAGIGGTETSPVAALGHRLDVDIHGDLVELQQKDNTHHHSFKAENGAQVFGSVWGNHILVPDPADYPALGIDTDTWGVNAAKADRGGEMIYQCYGDVVSHSTMPDGANGDDGCCFVCANGGKLWAKARKCQTGAYDGVLHTAGNSNVLAVINSSVLRQTRLDGYIVRAQPSVPGSGSIRHTIYLEGLIVTASYRAFYLLGSTNANVDLILAPGTRIVVDETQNPNPGTTKNLVAATGFGLKRIIALGPVYANVPWPVFQTPGGANPNVQFFGGAVSGTVTATWNYVTPVSDTQPLSGEVTQCDTSPEVVRVHDTDSGATDRSGILAALVPGDRIAHWEILSIAAVGSVYEFTVNNTTQLTDGAIAVKFVKVGGGTGFTSDRGAPSEFFVNNSSIAVDNDQGLP